MDRKEAVTILQEKRDLTRKLEAAEKSADWAAKDRVDSSSLRASQHGRYADALDMAISALSPPNEPLTLDELREMGGQPYWHVGLREESPPPHWNILDPFYAKHIEDYKYGENWLAYRRPLEGEV